MGATAEERRSFGATLAAAAGRLAVEQRADGEIPVSLCRAGETGAGSPDRTLFASALAVPFLDSLAASGAPRAAGLAAAARGFLRRERGRGDLVRFWPRSHPRGRALPPDLDDTAAVARALGARRPARLGRLLAAQRDGDGRLRTWLLPRSAVGLLRFPELLAALPLVSARHPFWTRSEAHRDDVDAGANAQALAWLGDRPELAAAAAWLCELARTGREEEADRWHRCWGVRWLIARAAGRAPSLAAAARALAARVGEEAGQIARAGAAADVALALATGAAVRAPAPARVTLAARLLAEQDAEGGWPRAGIWFGGPRRTVDWGSAALSTALAAGALAAEVALRDATG